MNITNETSKRLDPYQAEGLRRVKERLTKAADDKYIASLKEHFSGCHSGDGVPEVVNLIRKAKAKLEHAEHYAVNWNMEGDPSGAWEGAACEIYKCAMLINHIAQYVSWPSVGEEFTNDDGTYKADVLEQVIRGEL